MSVENVRYAAVNLSSMYIPVYSSLVYSGIHVGGKTAGGTQIGKIYPNEFYTVIPNDSFYVTSFKIYFRNSSGQGTYGYIETSKGDTLGRYAWDAHQHPYHYYNSNGSTLVESKKTVPINDKIYRIFTVTRDVSYRAPNGTLLGTIYAGMELATLTSETGKTYSDYMVFFFKRNPASTWTRLHANYNYCFVDLDIEIGNMPNNRAIR